MQYYNCTKCSCHELDYKFNITQHHDPYISCFVIVNHLSQQPHLTIHHKSSECFFHCYALTTDSNSIPICDSAFEHIFMKLAHAFTLLQSRDRDVVLC